MVSTIYIVVVLCVVAILLMVTTMKTWRRIDNAQRQREHRREKVKDRVMLHIIFEHKSGSKY